MIQGSAGGAGTYVWPLHHAARGSDPAQDRDVGLDLASGLVISAG